MAIPTSPSYGLFDWGVPILEGGSGVLLDAAGDGILTSASKSRGAPFVEAALGSEVLVLQSGDGLASRVTLPLNVPSVHTLEFRLRLDLLPEDFSDPTHHHVFLGVLNIQGGAAGLLISQEGLAIVGDPKVPVAPLTGSQGLIVDSDDLVIRILVNGNSGTASLYVTLQGQLAETGHVLRRTVKIPKSLQSWGDALLLEVVGQGTGAGKVTLKTLRLGEGLVLPNKRPVAVVGSDQAVAKGAAVLLDGTQSRDPEGATLTYHWTTLRQPDGANVTLTGMVRASKAQGALNFYSPKKGSAGNGQRVFLTDPGAPHATLDLALVGEVVEVTLRNEGPGASQKTSAFELLDALTNPLNASYVAAVAEVLSAELIGSGDVLVAAVPDPGFELTGGADSELAECFFFPSTPGLYEFELTVNDGDLTSLSARTLVTCLETPVEIGRTPEPEFIWSYLSDFCRLVADKGKLEPLWSALIQLIGAEMLRAWQVDYSKSLRDIPRRFQHKWVSYPVRTSPAGTLEGSLFTAEEDLDLQAGDFVELRSGLERLYGTVTAVTGPEATLTVNDPEGLLSTLSWEVSFLRVTRIPIHEDTVSIPRLQRSPGPETSWLTEGVDYEVAGGYLTFTAPPWTLETLSELPEAWWAEYTYVDNWQGIENNFGLLVGLRKEDFSAFSGGDYLSSVRALHFALWSGPTLSNIRLGAQVFFNLPFAEVEGTIVEVEPSFSETQGRILIQDKADSSILRSYYYPLAVGLAISPDTGLPYQVGDEVPAFRPLSQGAQVEDYLNAPSWYDGLLEGAEELRRFHTFRVAIDLSAVENTLGFGLVLDFVKKAKPSHTDVFLVGVRGVQDEINVTDKAWLTGTLRVTEAPYLTPDGAIHSGTAQQASPTSLRLATTAGVVDGLYTGMLLRIETGPGAGQTLPIEGYIGATRDASVAEWNPEYGTPEVGSTYAVVNPPPFPVTGHHALDIFDGRGNWNRAEGQLNWPLGGEAPTARVTFANPVGVLAPGETIKTSSVATPRFMGRVKEVHGSTLYLDVRGGSLPQVGVQLRGQTSGATVDVTASEIGAWPAYAYINRARSEIWIPLEPDTVLGPEDPTAAGQLQSYNAFTFEAVLDPLASSEDDAYVNWKLKVGSSWKRVVSYAGATQTAVFDADLGVLGNEVYTLHPPKPICRLKKLDFFEPGAQVTGQTSGHTARVQYFGPSYLRLIDPDRNPYEAFSPGEILVGPQGEQARAVSDAFFVTPDDINRLDRASEVGPEVRSGYRVGFYIGLNGRQPALDMGLVLDDVELFQYPFDPNVPNEEQMVPSHGPGLYWWLDHKLTYNHVDLDPDGPDPEPVWHPSPAVPAVWDHDADPFTPEVELTALDPGWNSNVLADVAICRVVSVTHKPSRLDPIPDPVLEGAI